MLALSQVEGHPSDSILTRSPCSEPNFGCINCVRYSQISDGTPANLLICGLWKFFTIEQISWNHVKRESLFKERKKLEGIKLFSCLDSKKYLLTPLDHFYSDRGAFDYRVMGFGDTLNFRSEVSPHPPRSFLFRPRRFRLPRDGIRRHAQFQIGSISSPPSIISIPTAALSTTA